MDNKLPLVSVIVPTTHDRGYFNNRIKQTYDRQDYKNKELIVDYGSENIGLKRNKMCGMANGEIILFMDSDDYYRDDWTSKQVEALLTTNADITGLSELYFYDPIKNLAWFYKYWDKTKWVHGSTMAFKKELWNNHKFKPTPYGEDTIFVWECNCKIVPHYYKEGHISIIHSGTKYKNTSPKHTDQTIFQPIEPSIIEGILKEDLSFYKNIV